MDARPIPEVLIFPVPTIRGGGDDVEYDIYSILAAAIGHAQQRVWIMQACFAPEDTFTEIIGTAARRGVDVRLLLPAVSDEPLVIQASRSSYEDLLEAGVRIYERTTSTLHAKTVVIDGVWTSIGSTNKVLAEEFSGSGCKSTPKAIVAGEHQIRSVHHFRVCHEPVESQIGMQGTSTQLPPQLRCLFMFILNTLLVRH